MDLVDRETAVELVHAYQARGKLLAWSFDEEHDEVELFVPDDCDVRDYPNYIGSIRVLLTWLPRPKELTD